jgi:hypothetical protein
VTDSVVRRRIRLPASPVDGVVVVVRETVAGDVDEAALR